MKAEHVKALFLLAYFEKAELKQIENQYWPDAYVAAKAESPWWVVTTEMGDITIGWRKHVIAIDWEPTGVRCLVTQDVNVTKTETMAHAYSHGMAVAALAMLRREWKRQTYRPEHDERGWQPK